MNRIAGCGLRPAEDRAGTPIEVGTSTTGEGQGANLVEFALIAPFIFVLLFGIVEFAWVFATNPDVKQGAREAARITAVNEPPADAITDDDHSEPLFRIGIKDAPRFAAVPILSADPSNGSDSYTIEEFKPVYLDIVYLKCNANTCDVVHSSGIPSSGTCLNPITSDAKSCGWNEVGNKGVVAMTSYLLTIEMLPLEIREKFPATAGTVVYNRRTRSS